MPTFPAISSELTLCFVELAFRLVLRARFHGIFPFAGLQKRELSWKPNQPGASCLRKFNAQ